MHTNIENKPEKQITLINFSYWYYKFNLSTKSGTWYCIVPPHHIKHTPSY